MNLTYPEGDPVNVGDFVWLNEGSILGFVTEILTDPKDYDWLDDSHIHSPRIFFSDLYPYEAIKELNKVKGQSGGGSVNYWIYDYTDFKDEGIGLVESKYKEDLEKAISIAKKDFEDHFCIKVGNKKLSEEMRWDWVIDFFSIDRLDIKHLGNRVIQKEIEDNIPT